MKTTNRILLVLFFVVVALPLPAQESSSWVRRTLGRLIAPVSKLDTTAVYVLPPRWNAALLGDLHQTSVSQTFSFERQGQPVLLESSLREGLYTGAGVAFGYGGLTLSYSHQLGRDAVSSKSNSLDWCGSGYGLQVAYYDIRQPLEYMLQTGAEGDPERQITCGTSAYPGQLKMVVGEGLYALNRKTFSYCAAYKGNQVQRRSAGSWMLSVKYFQGELVHDSREMTSSMLYGLTRLATAQGSIGAGYSYNFVALHRQGAGSDWRSIRNLTFNLTALPMLIVYDRHLVTRTVTDPASGKESSQTTHRLNASPHLNYVARAGIGYNWGHCFLGLSGRYDVFSSGGTTKLVGSGVAVDVKTAGHFNKWSAAMNFRLKF